MGHMDDATVLQVEDLSVAISGRGDDVAVLEGVSFSVRPGRTLALIGESGCGKSMAALSVLGLLPDGVRRTGGAIRLHGEDLAAVPPARLRALRGSAVAMILQEPMTALNPVLAVGEQIAETLRLHQGLGHAAARRAALEMLRAVGIAAPERRIDSFPHQLSGGMRQRVMIAMALACRPQLLIADELTTALDVTVQGDPAHQPRPPRGDQHRRRGCRALCRDLHGERSGRLHTARPAAPRRLLPRPRADATRLHHRRCGPPHLTPASRSPDRLQAGVVREEGQGS